MLRSISAESLLSSEERIDLERDLNHSKQQRPLSMIGMLGSLESSEAVSPGPKTPDKGHWSSDDQLQHSSSSKEMLRTINEDINKIRERRARKSFSSSETSLEGAFHHVVHISSPNGSGLGLDQDPQLQLEVDIENVIADLPSHSICVDSGMVMEEEMYCSHESLVTPSKSQTDKANSPIHLTEDNRLLPDISTGMEKISTPEKNQNEDFRIIPSQEMEEKSPPNIVQSQSPVQKPDANKPNMKEEEVLSVSVTQSDAKLPFTGSAQTSMDAEDDNVFCKNEETPVGEVNKDNNGKTALPIAHTDTVLEKQESSKASRNPKLLTKIDPINSSSSGQTIVASTTEGKELANEPLEPLLSSQSVSLKAKLQRLSTLYDCDDGTDVKHMSEEPSGAYDVFKSPSKSSHKRSRYDIDYR